MIPTSRLLAFTLAMSLAASAHADADSAPLHFNNAATTAGIDFLPEDGSSGLKHFVETAGSGGGWLDFDGDGLLDLYLLNGAQTPGRELASKPSNRLYRNLGNRFADVTANAGVGDEGYGMGFCVGDIDADGLIDFMVTNYGDDRLFRNLGDGRFKQVAGSAGVADPRWSTGCAFGDLDGDGDLDLYVSRYARFDFEHSPFCGDRARDLRTYCNPTAFRGEVDSLYINDGKGRFVDQARQRGIHQGDEDRGFAVLLSDLDDDGDLDIYVANDGSLNRVYRNDGKGHFEDESLLSGAGLNARGLAEAGMGADIGDVDGDGHMDVLVTNYSMENNTLYRNLGDFAFDDVTARFGLAGVSFRSVGWGIQFLDADNDGDLDLAIANGHPIDNIEQFESMLSYRQHNQLFENLNGKRFREITSAGDFAKPLRSSRGLAAGDYDNDGRVDLLVLNSRDRAELQRNLGPLNHWLGLRLIGPENNRFAIGARITLESATGKQVREIRSGGGFLTQADLRAHFGLGPNTDTVSYQIRWPGGKIQEGRIDQVDRYVDIHVQ